MGEYIMIKWNKLLHALNQTFNSQTSAALAVETAHPAFDADAKEQAVVSQHRFESDIDSSSDLQKLLSDRIALKSDSHKRLLNAFTDALAEGGKWPR
jgi:hypothetical protein